MSVPVPSGSPQVEAACLILREFGHEVVGQVAGVANLAHALSENSNLRDLQLTANAEKVVGLVEAMRAAAVALLEDRPVQRERVELAPLISAVTRAVALGDQRVEVLRDIGTLTAHPVLLERVLLMIVDASTAAGAAALSFAAETVEDKAVLVIRYRGTRPTKVDRWPLVKAMCAAQAIEAERETGEAETTIRLAGRRAVHAR